MISDLLIQNTTSCYLCLRKNLCNQFLLNVLDLTHFCPYFSCKYFDIDKSMDRFLKHILKEEVSRQTLNQKIAGRKILNSVQLNIFMEISLSKTGCIYGAILDNINLV